jgi:hypothetical protein
MIDVSANRDETATKKMPNRPPRLLALAITAVGLLASACSMSSPFADRPNWSLMEKAEVQQPQIQAQAPRKYGDWSGAGAPKPLTVD